MSAFQVKVMRSLKLLMAKVDSQSKIIERLEARLNQQQGAAGVCTDNAAAELRKRLPLQTHAALLEFEKLLETEENMSAIVSGLGFSYSFIFFMKMLIFPFVF